jgi:hypothetical protein
MSEGPQGGCAEPGASARDGENLRIPQVFRCAFSTPLDDSLRPVFACSPGIVNSGRLRAQ